jgi:hypothetical protein
VITRPDRPAGDQTRKAVDVSTHRRAWKQRAGVVVALVFGALLAVPATPALAAPSISNVAASPNSVEAGGPVKVTYDLNFTDPLASADVTVTSSNPKLNCVDGCSRGRVNQNGTFDATFRAASDAPNSSATITIKATDSNGPNKQDESATVMVTLVAKAPPTPQTVKSVSGKVVISDNGEPIAGALVMLRDSQNKQRQTNTDGSGNFKFTGSASDPIAPGRIWAPPRTAAPPAPSRSMPAPARP